MKHPFKLGIIQLLTIPLVMAIFKLPAEKPVLSIAANVVFWLIALFTITYQGSGKMPIRFLGFQFLLTSVLPVTILRFQSWGGDFNSSAFLNITGAQWHAYSNMSFLLMVLGTFGVALFLRKKDS